MPPPVRVSLDIDAGVRDRLLTSTDGVVGQAVRRAAGRVRDQAKANVTSAGRVRTGEMRRSIQSEIASQPPRVIGRVVAPVAYAMYQHEGTSGPIVPRRARVLRFRPAGARAYIFRPQVSGVEGTPFLTDALRRLSIRDFT